MSEFIEIGDYVFRRFDIKHVTGLKKGIVVLFANGTTGRFDEPYESVRDKLMGKPPKPRVDDRRQEFVDGVVDYLRANGKHDAACLVAEYYQSTMLSETEGAG